MADDETKSPAPASTPAPAPAPAPAPRAPYRSPLASLREEIDQMFERTLSGWPFGRVDPFATVPPALKPFEHTPKAEMSETDQAYTLTVELPGIDEKDVKVTLDGDVLSITGEKTAETRDEKTHFTERSYGSFQRAFRLPEDADTRSIEASSDKGVLTVSIPKLAAVPPKGRTIEVKKA